MGCRHTEPSRLKELSILYNSMNCTYIKYRVMAQRQAHDRDKILLESCVHTESNERQLTGKLLRRSLSWELMLQT